ncbi:uncharacterized protein LOC123503463 [Portunus trituberculatus]|uniref:uncharacterized protein LOC123503463 n=1 Tax=Portunus trituberculatus TaxID=210409 RepID=UPI001E1D030E|nr:uncharacterized protein LOC123503463 [Portunus trituberculatus]
MQALWKALIQPILNYCNQIWSPHRKGFGGPAAHCTLHIACINVCGECKTESGKDGGCVKTERDKDGGCCNIHSIIASCFLVLWKVVHTVLTGGLYVITHIDRL